MIETEDLISVVLAVRNMITHESVVQNAEPRGYVRTQTWLLRRVLNHMTSSILLDRTGPVCHMTGSLLIVT